MNDRCCVARVFRFGALVATLAIPGRAAAQDDAARRAAAQALFDEAQQLLKVRDFARACPKLEEVNNLQPGKLGAMMELAACYEGWGKTASAWARYRSAADLATKSGDGRKKEADAKVAALEPLVPRLLVLVPESMRKEPGLVIETDAVPLGPGAWGTAIPVDPGPHEVAASAPDKRKWSTKIEINRPGDTITVTIPSLQDDGASTPPAPPIAPKPAGPPEPDAGGNRAVWPVQRTVALGVAGLGLVGLGVGIGTGLDAASKVDAAKPECNAATPAICTPRGSELLDGAKVTGTVSTVGFIAGGALLAGGVVLFLTAPSATTPGAAKASPSRRAVWAGPLIGHTNGAALGGTW